ncbi:MAG: hypothetical protein FD153_1349 [Rhodospirillaceae bacterium]|nr:MAG: hypothetical protein FD153_1349 [Rhodospirillaceae bacterium]
MARLKSTSNLVGLITGVGVPSGVSLLWLIKRLRGRRPERIELHIDTTCALMFEGDTIVAPINVVKLYQDISLRRIVRLMVEPLTKDGISEFLIREDGKTILPVTIDDERGGRRCAHRARHRRCLYHSLSLFQGT